MKEHTPEKFTLVQELIYDLRYVLEQTASALKDKRPIEPDILRHNIFRAKMMSELLSSLRDNITKENRKELGKKVYSLIEMESKAINSLKEFFIDLENRYFSDKTQFQPKTDDEMQKQDYEIAKISKSNSVDSDKYFENLLKNPVLGLFEELKVEIWLRRILSRYLRSRFGVKVCSYKTIISKRPTRKQLTFQQWAFQNNIFKNGYSKEVMQLALEKWRFYILIDQQLLNYAFNRLAEIDTRIEFLKNTIYLSFFESEATLELEDLSFDILTRIKPALKHMDDLHNVTVIELKQELSLNNYEKELRHLTSSIATQLSLKVNKNIEKTLSVEGKDFEHQLLQKIPGSILIALMENARGRVKCCGNKFIAFLALASFS